MALGRANQLDESPCIGYNPTLPKRGTQQMFEGLTNKLQAVFDKLSKRGVLTEADVDAALREVRLALLEADVHYSVVKDFLGRVRERAVGAEVRKA